MALTGTLKDFSVTDILQLIGQQSKSGVLHLKNDTGEEIHISFHQGAVVGAEHVNRSQRDLLGRMLVRARLISERQLADALETQRRTLRRLGDILVEEGAISQEILREMTQLQITETLGGLFYWKRGTYAFEAKPVYWDEDSIRPLRSEAVLMDGFRMVDEWPIVRRKIVSPQSTFEVLEPLPEEGASAPVEESSFADLLDEDEGGVSPAERRVMELITPERTVEELVDLGRLGTFETWKALANLVEKGHLRLVVPDGPEPVRREADEERPWPSRNLPALVYGALSLVLLLGAGLSWRSNRLDSDRRVREAIAASHGAANLDRARFAAEVFRVMEGRGAQTWDELVEAGLLSAAELAELRQKDPDSLVLPRSSQDTQPGREKEEL